MLKPIGSGLAISKSITVSRNLFSGSGCGTLRIAGNNAPVLIVRHPGAHQYDGRRRDGNEWRRGYKNFGHKPEGEPLATKLFYCFLGAMIVGTCIDWKKLAKIVGFPKVDADAGMNAEMSDSNAEQLESGEDSDGDDEDEQGKKKPRKEKIGFRDRKVMDRTSY